MIISVLLCVRIKSKVKESQVLNEIRKRCEVDELSVDHDLAILMIVGEGMNQVVGTASKITHALSESNINLK